MLDWVIYGGIAGALTSAPLAFKYIRNSIMIKDASPLAIENLSSSHSAPPAVKDEIPYSVMKSDFPKAKPKEDLTFVDDNRLADPDSSIIMTNLKGIYAMVNKVDVNGKLITLDVSFINNLRSEVRIGIGSVTPIWKNNGIKRFGTNGRSDKIILKLKYDPSGKQRFEEGVKIFLNKSKANEVLAGLSVEIYDLSTKIRSRFSMSLVIKE